MLSIAIIDIIGLTYDGTTLAKRGLGGSESAVILMSRELAALGFHVTVFNNCIDREAVPGVYDGVTYVDHTALDSNNDYEFDVVISSRTVAPFLPAHLYGQFADLHPARYAKMAASARLKIVWMHDTFCRGDHLLEELVVSGHIDELFTLSDFHTSYVTTCDHGHRRNFEMLKNKIFMTRNGVVKYHEEVDIAAKDPFLYVYNASVTKGMLPLVNEIWPKVKAAIPRAKLKVIGGYYRFRENAEPDEQEKTWRAMVADPKYQQLDIEFTGVITQREIADILCQSSFMLFPGAFPETFGISSLESLIYNTPLITTRFGALEETAVNQACYLIDYAIEPNGLFPNINKEQQVERFTQEVLQANANRYLHQQKQYYCNIVKDICTWNTVALQWKQHLYKKLNKILPVNEYRRVSQINNRVKQVFGRRFSNAEENYVPRRTEQKILVITPMYNASKYIGRCIESVVNQDYENWQMIITDDASSDDSYDQAIAAAGKEYGNRIKVYKNSENRGAVYNQISAITGCSKPDDIVMLLDGDDWLTSDNQIFHYYNNLYDGSTEFSYGSCWSLVDNIPLIAQPYPEYIKQNKLYRRYKFNWNMPYTHLRTFKAGLLEGIENSRFQDSQGNWFKAGGDGAVFYALIERADPSKVKVVQDIVYQYNDINPLNDYKVNGVEQNKNASAILQQGSIRDKFSVVMPTMWRAADLTHRLLKDLVAHDLVGEILIINNDAAATPYWAADLGPKVLMLNQKHNIKVNPAWNLGVDLAENNRLCIVNDDIVFDTAVFDKLYPLITEHNGVYGMITGEAHFGHPPSTDYSISIKEWQEGENVHGFGQLMFVHKNNWKPIIKGLDIYYGDDFIFHSHLAQGLKNYTIYNFRFESIFAATTQDKTITEGALDRESVIWQQWAVQHPLAKTNSNHIKEQLSVKRILIAIPTNKYIEPATFKSIYDLEIPEGYTTEFQYSYGYQIDQIRNLIAHWATNYDYLFSVDSDISFKPDTLKKMLAHNVPVVSGLYIQRKPGQHILELYRGGVNVPYDSIKGQGLIEVDSCGFGCVLVNSEVIRAVGYPQFVYKSAIDHSNTLSEDTYFCHKAREKGHRIYADTTILCEHHGASTFIVDTAPVPVISGLARLRELYNTPLLPKPHVDYLWSIKNIEPRVIYDIGACVLHWTKPARQVWPNARFIMFEAMPETEPIFKENGLEYEIGLLSDTDGKAIAFYQNTEHPGGNSYYKENEAVNPEAPRYFNDSHRRTMITKTLDTIVKERGFPAPDLIKMDVQGSELDVLKGAKETLASCKDLILELQRVEYNKGAPLREEVIDYLDSIGFDLVRGLFCDNGPDGDYHFRRR